jgi:hypothetical protein
VLANADHDYYYCNTGVCWLGPAQLGPSDGQDPADGMRDVWLMMMMRDVWLMMMMRDVWLMMMMRDVWLMMMMLLKIVSSAIYP